MGKESRILRAEQKKFGEKGEEQINEDMDYYKILQVDKNSTEDDLKRAYRKFSNEKKQADAKFNQISEAYEVLSDPSRRRVYDQYGAEGLKIRFPSSSPNTNVRFSNSPDDIFETFFGSSSISGGVFDGNPSGPQKDPPIHNTLPCTLQDLYLGTTKKMKISRNIVDVNRNTLEVDEVLSIVIKRGWKKGTKITFPEKGNVRPNAVSSDLIFTVDEKPHPVFVRDGNDLIITRNISALEAFTGCSVRIPTLDGRTLTIPINVVIHPNYEEVVRGEGMPIQNDPNNRGNLIIKFTIKFPTSLTSEQKAGIRRALGST